MDFLVGVNMKKTILIIILFALCVSISSAGVTDKLRAVIAAKNRTDVTAPTWSSTTVAADGDTVTVVFSENLNDTALGGGEFDLDCDGAGGADNVLVYASGDGTATWVFTSTTTIESGETCNQDFDGAANEAEDDAGNDLADFTDQAVTNNSTQDGGGPDTYYYPASVTESSDDLTSTTAWTHSALAYGNRIQAGDNGTVTSIEIKMDNNGDSIAMNIGLYDDSDNLIAQCTTTVDVGEGVHWEACVISQAVTSGTWYRVYYNTATDAGQMRYDTGATGYYGTCAYSAGALCDPIPDSETDAGYAAMARMYVD